MKLYEISQQYRELLNKIDGLEDIEPEFFEDTLDAINEEFDQKADNIACLIKELGIETKALDNEAKILRDRSNQKKRAIDRLKLYLKTEMENIDKTKIETTRNIINIRKNPNSLYLDEKFVEWAVNQADHLLRFQPPQPDKTLIREELLKGCEIPHARMVQNTSLVVK